jgi:hypothetical protein
MPAHPHEFAGLCEDFGDIILGGDASLFSNALVATAGANARGGQDRDSLVSPARENRALQLLLRLRRSKVENIDKEGKKLPNMSGQQYSVSLTVKEQERLQFETVEMNK